MKKRHIRLAVGVAILAVAVVSVAGSAATQSTAQKSYHRPSARLLSEATAALTTYLAHGHQTAWHAQTLRNGLSGTPSAAASYNWSGYADSASTAGTFSAVSGTWVTPAVTCTNEDQLTSEWVGLDGWTSSTVEQDGTLDWCFEGTAFYYTWYEMYPAGTVEVGTTLKPGDAISASVVKTGTSYRMAVTDTTNTANSFAVKKTCAAATCVDTSAEWIAERPAFSIGIAPLADYSSWTLKAGKETASGVAGSISSYATSYQVTSIDATDSYHLDTTSALKTPNQFTTTWLNSY
jgi:hypothetical protein